MDLGQSSPTIPLWIVHSVLLLCGLHNLHYNFLTKKSQQPIFLDSLSKSGLFIYIGQIDYGNPFFPMNFSQTDFLVTTAVIL